MGLFLLVEVTRKLDISKGVLLYYKKWVISYFTHQSHVYLNSKDENKEEKQSVLKEGFTIIELIMVMVIIGILSALAIPRIDSFNTIRLAGGANKLIADIRYIQQLAVAQHTNTRIIFNISQDYYVAEQLNKTTGIWKEVSDPFTRAPLIMNYKTDPQYAGIDIVEANFGGLSELQFNWQGSPSNGGIVRLALRDNQRRVKVLSGTGTVELE
ncbi:MAG: type II secretion system GspH family protein [Candidatus Omnitrophica bacterium]|nr:type II secretion system GspH family protein [Candidatus Omnitrophota bacterium]